MQLVDIYKQLSSISEENVSKETLDNDNNLEEEVASQASVLEETLDIVLDEESNCLFIPPSKWLSASKELSSNKKMSFDYLMCITSYDIGSGKLGLAYNLYSNEFKHSLEVRVEFEESINIPSVASIWRTADWHEREAYDMMGVMFLDHPDMKRILLSDDWEGYPLRKDYEQPDYYRGLPVPKDKTAWE